jgi:hypothetical protein
MFATNLDLFSIGTVAIPTHTKLIISKTGYVPNLKITKHVPKQPIEPVCVLAINLAIPPNTILSNNIYLKPFSI